MAKKKTPNEPNNDFASEEDVDICGFSDEPIITGECIASFSFVNYQSNTTFVRIQKTLLDHHFSCL